MCVESIVCNISVVFLGHSVGIMIVTVAAVQLLCNCDDCLIQELIEEQMALKRIADIAIDLYAVTSVLARASRSKSIGLQHCDNEVNTSQYVLEECLET